MSVVVFSQNLTGNLQFDSEMLLSTNAIKSSKSGSSKKQIITAALFSAAIPGAGQIYNSDYWKAALFLVAEGALIYTNIAYNKKGDDKTDYFEAFARKHWSPEQYARYTIRNKASINSELANDTKYTAEYLMPGGKLNWERMNEFEMKLGSWYSHQLPEKGSQQYYELIGKYQQFISGWDDVDTMNYKFEDRKTRTSEYYMTERGKANDYYNIATKAVLGIMVNHLLSAIEAAYSRHLMNEKIKIDMSVDNYYHNQDLYLIPKLTLKYSL